MIKKKKLVRKITKKLMIDNEKYWEQKYWTKLLKLLNYYNYYLFS